MNKLLSNFQTNTKHILNEHESAVIALKRRHSDTWRTESPEYWLKGLQEEIEELKGVLNGTHDDDLIWELAQIAAIAMNWVDKVAIEADIKEILESGNYITSKELIEALMRFK